MNAEPEFTIGLSNESEPRFLVYDRCALPPADARLRAALERHRDVLALRLDAMQRLLATHEPERAERLMIDGAFAKIERIVMRARPNDPARLDLDIDAISRALAERTDRTTT